jgi:hypothetical protein
VRINRHCEERSDEAIQTASLDDGPPMCPCLGIKCRRLTAVPTRTIMGHRSTTNIHIPLRVVCGGAQLGYYYRALCTRYPVELRPKNSPEV